MLSRTQLENATTEDLYRLVEQTEAELARRELLDREPPLHSRVVVKETTHPKGTLRLELVNCDKNCCNKCQSGPGHGPYWFLYFRKNGKLTIKYIGEVLPDELYGYTGGHWY